MRKKKCDIVFVTRTLSQQMSGIMEEKTPTAHHTENGELKFTKIYNQLTTLMNGDCDCRFLVDEKENHSLSITMILK